MDLQLLEYLQTFLTPRRIALFKEVMAHRTRHFTVVTEDLYQMHNASAVLRSCDVFGIQDLHVVQERFGKRMDREIAMGAQKWVTVHRHKSTSECIAKLRKDGYKIVATTPHSDSQLLPDFNVQSKSALFFGTEKAGLSPQAMEQADEFLKIPMYGFTESLNISVSAAIILQQVVTKMKREVTGWELSEVEKQELEMHWTRQSIKRIDDILERYYKEKNL